MKRKGKGRKGKGRKGKGRTGNSCKTLKEMEKKVKVVKVLRMGAGRAVLFCENFEKKYGHRRLLLSIKILKKNMDMGEFFLVSII